MAPFSSGKEVTFAENEILLSTTDLSSKITYANDNFCKIAGFTLDEMVGNPHKMVRHPDMPKAAFADLWKTIQSGDSWMGPVKNRCKDGSYYWVNAFVTPIKNETGKVVEYQSVRTCPSRELVNRADTEYEKIRNNKKSAALNSPRDYTLYLLLAMAVLVFCSLGNLLVNGINVFNLIMMLVAVAVTSGFVVWRNAYLKVVGKAHKVFDNPMMSYLYMGNNDLLGHINLAMEMQSAKLKAVVGRVNDVSTNVNVNAKKNNESSNEVAKLLDKQNDQVSLMATAMDQFSSTIQELTLNVNNASQAANLSEEQTNLGKDAVDKVIKAIENLDQQLITANEQVNKLVEGNNSIHSTLSEINAIAEQTNLLALNAAIEAARAGEQGRGFSVVADEVRSLAGRTQQSTQVITKLLSELQAVSDSAVVAMQEGNNLSQQSVVLAKENGTSLEEIQVQVTKLADLNRSIAAALEEQSTVANQVTQNVHEIRDLSMESGEHGKSSYALGQELQKQIDQQTTLVKQFA